MPAMVVIPRSATRVAPRPGVPVRDRRRPRRQDPRARRQPRARAAFQPDVSDLALRQRGRTFARSRVARVTGRGARRREAGARGQISAGRPRPAAVARAAARRRRAARTVRCGSSVITVPVPTRIGVGVGRGGRARRPVRPEVIHCCCRRWPRRGRRGSGRTSRSRTGTRARRGRQAAVQRRGLAAQQTPVDDATPAHAARRPPPALGGDGIARGDDDPP